MGDTLDYERGKLCIGRRVRVWMETGRGNGKNGTPALLKGASPKAAQVRFAGHGYDTFVAWDRVRDWVAGNNGPAPEPPPPPMPVIKRVPEPTALEARELKAQPMHRVQMQPTVSPVIDAAAAASLKAAIAESEVVDLGDLGSRLRKATSDLEAARGILRDMQAEHARHVAEAEKEIQAKQKALIEIRDQAKRAWEMAESAIGGA